MLLRQVGKALKAGCVLTQPANWQPVTLEQHARIVVNAGLETGALVANPDRRGMIAYEYREDFESRLVAGNANKRQGRHAGKPFATSARRDAKEPS